MLPDDLDLPMGDTSIKPGVELLKISKEAKKAAQVAQQQGKLEGNKKMLGKFLLNITFIDFVMINESVPIITGHLNSC